MTVGVGAYALHVWPQFENESVDLRFSLRGTSRPPADVTVVAIDEKTFSDLRQQWPFPRSLHAAMIERLHADGASTIVYDVQFTEPSRLGPRDDLALYEAIGRAGKVVLATTEVDAALSPLLGGYLRRRSRHRRRQQSPGRRRRRDPPLPTLDAGPREPRAGRRPNRRACRLALALHPRQRMD